VLLLLLAAALFLFDLRGHAFWDYDEGTYAEVMCDTAASSDPLTLHQMGNPWFEKPPLYFWAGMALGQVIESQELAYRLPAAFMGIVSIFLVFCITLLVAGDYLTALLAGIIILLTPPYFEAGRQVRLDVPVTAAILFTFYSFLRSSNDRRWALGIGAGLGVGIMIKSVIGLFGAVAIVVWSLVHWDFRWLRNIYVWIGGVVGALIVLPWHVYESGIYGHQFWHSYLFYHVVDRFRENILTSNAVQASNATYLTALFEYAEPWAVVFIVAAVACLTLSRTGARIREMLVFALVPLVILCLFFNAGTKIDYYLIPIYPFAAVFVALAAAASFHRISSVFARRVFLSIGAAILAGAFGYTLYVGFHHSHQYWINQEISDEERTAGLIFAKNPDLPIYTYQYDYWDSIRYYAGGRPVLSMTDDQALDRSFFLVVGTESNFAFPSEIQAHLTKIFAGLAITVYRFDL